MFQNKFFIKRYSSCHNAVELWKHVTFFVLECSVILHKQIQIILYLHSYTKTIPAGIHLHFHKLSDSKTAN